MTLTRVQRLVRADSYLGENDFEGGMVEDGNDVKLCGRWEKGMWEILKGSIMSNIYSRSADIAG